MSLSVLVAVPLAAATRVTIQDLKDAPERYYGETVLLEGYYDKESPIWVQALPDAEDWIGFFVTGKPEKALTWSGEYYNLLFAPYAMREAVRSLRGGDKVTIVGEAFQYHSISLEGAGIHVQEIRQGWGASAKSLGTSEGSSAPEPTAAVTAVPGMAAEPHGGGKYVVTINGKRYEGLRVGDPYNFDGFEFQVDADQ